MDSPEAAGDGIVHIVGEDIVGSVVVVGVEDNLDNIAEQDIGDMVTVEDIAGMDCVGFVVDTGSSVHGPLLDKVGMNWVGIEDWVKYNMPGVEVG